MKIKRDLYHQRHGTISCYLLSCEKAKTFLFFFGINWSPEILVQFCYLRQHLRTDIVFLSLQWSARIENGLKLRSTTRYRTYNDQLGTRLIQINKLAKKATLKKFVAGHAWPGREDQYESVTGASGCKRMVIRLNVIGTFLSQVIFMSRDLDSVSYYYLFLEVV